MGKDGSNQLLYLGVATVVVILGLAYYANGKFNQHERAITDLNEALTAHVNKNDNNIGILNGSIDRLRDDVMAENQKLRRQLRRLTASLNGEAGGRPAPVEDEDDDEEDLIQSRRARRR